MAHKTIHPGRNKLVPPRLGKQLTAENSEKKDCERFHPLLSFLPTAVPFVVIRVPTVNQESTWGLIPHLWVGCGCFADFQTSPVVDESRHLGTGSSTAEWNVGDTAASHPWRSGVRPGVTCEADVVRTAAARQGPRPTDVTVIH